MKRKAVWLFVALAMVLATVINCPSRSSATQRYSLRFPANNYTLKTETVTSSQGKTEVTYRYYKDIVYVANPVDINYETMNVSVPVKVDGVAVDAANAPILFDINVGGYMANSANGKGTAPMPQFSFFPKGGPPKGGSGGAPGGPGGGPPGGNQLNDLALAAGYVVVDPGCRGLNNVAANGTYYGKAPAAIVDLKAAVRYIRYNTGVFPGNPEWIIATGGSAGGALSTLLGASGNSDLYGKYFKEIGAANEPDNIYASTSFSPITDLNHADGAYEWEFGTVPLNGKLVDQTVSKELKEAFAKYQTSLDLQGEHHFGTITAGNYAQYILETFLFPEATEYLSSLTAAKREAYLAKNPWVNWQHGAATFTWASYVAHVGRMKGVPAFSAFKAGTTPETMLFGDTTTNARNFTNFSLQHATGNPNAKISNSLQMIVNLMNPMYFIENNNSGCCNYWWIRTGTIDNNTAHVIAINLATLLQNKGKNVNVSMYWDGGHAVDLDPGACIAWIGKITGYTK